MQVKKLPDLPLYLALLPIVLLMGILSYNVLMIFQDEATSGANQFTLLFVGFVAAIIGLRYKVSFNQMLESVYKNIKTTSGAILILLFVGSLAGTWLISGIIPTMIYYGLKILNPTIFLAVAVVISAIISVVTGSSWGTTATIGIALIGIGKGLGINEGIIAGAVISGAYFGDKISPMSDTTNLAAAMAKINLFKHIYYMLYTTLPSISIALILFIILGFFQETQGEMQNLDILNGISNTFNISPWLLIVPVTVIVLIIKKVEPVVALLVGTVLGGIAAVIAQPQVLQTVLGVETLNIHDSYKAVMNAAVTEVSIDTHNATLNELFTSGGMEGMLSTIWLIIAAMVFGGVMEAIGALKSISKALLRMAKGDFGVFASTAVTCIFFNGTVSDQYLSIVVPGKMYADAFKDRGLAPENLSRTLEDSGTVTSVLFPWNTGGAYNAGVLNVATIGIKNQNQTIGRLTFW
ncbi:MAG: sodium:proton antiporter [Flavobacteriales bacterium]|nr:MAG: sodium:proton antiporter [Flavobacteriales bacterium]